MNKYPAFPVPLWGLPSFLEKVQKGTGRGLPENVSKQLITIYIVKSFIYWWKVHFLPCF